MCTAIISIPFVYPQPPKLGVYSQFQMGLNILSLETITQYIINIIIIIIIIIIIM